MQHQRNAHRLETASGEFRAQRARRRRQFGAAHVREGYTSSLEQPALFDDAGVPAACPETFRPTFALPSLPGVAAKRRALQPLQLRDNAVLKSGQIILDEIDVHRRGTAVRSLTFESATAQGFGVAGA